VQPVGESVRFGQQKRACYEARSRLHIRQILGLADGLDLFGWLLLIVCSWHH